MRALLQLDGLPGVFLLEQFHGPTCAFKDVALQFVGNLFELFLSRSDSAGPVTVVGATSGDTGSAAIEGLRGKANIRYTMNLSRMWLRELHCFLYVALVHQFVHLRVCTCAHLSRYSSLVLLDIALHAFRYRLMLILFYRVFILHPKGRVAAIQEAQMTTVLDANVQNVAVDGTFDDCQSIVKRLFEDGAFRSKHNLAAINSINWARILAQVRLQCACCITALPRYGQASRARCLKPYFLQIVYYFHAYNQWISQSGAAFGSPVQFSVPSGNFGNVMAGYYAKAMGLPVSTLIVSTNRNDILHRYALFGIVVIALRLRLLVCAIWGLSALHGFVSAAVIAQVHRAR